MKMVDLIYFLNGIFLLVIVVIKEVMKYIIIFFKNIYHYLRRIFSLYPYRIYDGFGYYTEILRKRKDSNGWKNS